MQQDRLGQWGRARITAEEYNHSLSKLVSTKRKVKPTRKAAFMTVFPVKVSPRLHSDEAEASFLPLKEASVTHPEHSQTLTAKEIGSNAEVRSPVEGRQKLQVFVRGLLLAKTVCLQLDLETSVAALKTLLEAESGIQPQHQQLYIGRNFQLCDLLSIRDHGIQQDQNIELRAGGLLGGGLLDEGQLRNTYFLNLSRQLGPQWVNLALSLGFSVSVVNTLKKKDTENVELQSLWMLDEWWKKQDPAAAPEELRAGLKAIRREDLARQVPGIEGTSFDVEQCASELARHYQETMKVRTYPIEKHLSREMDDIYVKPLLRQETNMPTSVSSLETETLEETGSQSEHTKTSGRATPDLAKSQHDRDKGFHVQKMSLDSYKDMLVLKTNRLLIRAEAGYGKTTLLKRIAYDWADLKIKGDQAENQQQSETTIVLGKYELVFLVEINRIGRNFDIIDAMFSQILTESTLKKNELRKYIQGNGERVLILLDGADEISIQRVKREQCKNGIDLNDVLSFKSLKSCKVIVTSRQKTANELLKLHAHYTKINVVGFDEKNREKYVRKYVISSRDNQNSFLNKVNGSEALRGLAEIPLFLWLMCNTWIVEGELPNQITHLFRDNFELLLQHKASKETDEQHSDTKTNISKLGRIALKGLLDPNGKKLHFTEAEIDSEDLEIWERSSDVGLLSKGTTFQRLKTVSHFSFLHKTFQEYCAAAYLVDLLTTDSKTFDQYLSQIIQGDVESLEYVLRFCCGLSSDATEKILSRIRDLLKQNKLKKSLHRISMLLIFEAHLKSNIKEFLETDLVQLPYVLQGEVLVAAHYFFTVGSEYTTLEKVDIQEISAKCQGSADFKLLTEILQCLKCKPSLNLVLNRTR